MLRRIDLMTLEVLTKKTNDSSGIFFLIYVLFFALSFVNLLKPLQLTSLIIGILAGLATVVMKAWKFVEKLQEDRLQDKIDEVLKNEKLSPEAREKLKEIANE